MPRSGRRFGKFLGLFFGIGNSTTLRASFVEPERVAGQPVNVRIGVLAREPVEVRSAEVIFRQSLRHQEYDANPLGGGWTWTLEHTTLDSAQFLQPGWLEAGTEVERMFRFPTPGGGPPTGFTEHTAAYYNAIARLELVDALDVKVAPQVKLLSPRGLNPGSERTTLEGTALTNLELTLERTWARPGETLAGEVAASAIGRPVRASRLSLGLRRWERAGRSPGTTGVRDDEFPIDELVLAEPVDLGYGVMERRAFSVKVPENACPTLCVGPRNAVRWLVRATLERGLAGDETVAREVNVYTAP